MPIQTILIAGQWRAARSSGCFHAENPATGETLPAEYPVSTWADCDSALDAAVAAAEKLRAAPAEQIAQFLDLYAERLEARAAEIVDIAHLETGLAKAPLLWRQQHHCWIHRR